jgi:hypothetical protein
MFFSSILVVVDPFNVKRLRSFKTKHDAPVGSNSHGPESPHVAFKRVQMIARNIERLQGKSRVEHS